MNKIILLFLLNVLLLACDNKKNTHSDALVQTQKQLTDSLNNISDTADFNGFGVAIVNENGPLYQAGFGYANIATKEKYTENTIQNIASISKVFLGIAMLNAQELGKLHLDDSVNKYLPFRVFNPWHPETPITIRHLVTHTSGIADTDDYLLRAYILYDTVNLANHLSLNIGKCKFSAPSTAVPMDAFLKNILEKDAVWYKKDGFLKNKPGEIFEYSNIGATLVALVIEKATGKKYDAFSKEYILNPLQMNSSGWGLHAVDTAKHTKLYINKTTAYPFYTCVTYPDGSMIISATDMSKFMSELIKGYLGNGTLLSKESYATYFTGQLKAENFKDRSTGEYSDEYNMGITMGISSTGNFGHTGGDPGLFSIMFINPKTKTGCYLIHNTDLNEKKSWNQSGRIWKLLNMYAQKLNKKN
jgi:CubicO group peptidase (beta-lactamase class C family)